MLHNPNHCLFVYTQSPRYVYLIATSQTISAVSFSSFSFFQIIEPPSRPEGEGREKIKKIGF